MHAHCSGFVLFDCVSDDILRRGVVGLDWCWGMRVTNFNEDLASHFSVFGVSEDARYFSFSRGRYHMLQNRAFQLD